MKVISLEEKGKKKTQPKKIDPLIVLFFTLSGKH